MSIVCDFTFYSLNPASLAFADGHRHSRLTESTFSRVDSLHPLYPLNPLYPHSVTPDLADFYRQRFKKYVIKMKFIKFSLKSYIFLLGAV
jgi:hypothetical protein